MKVSKAPQIRDLKGIDNNVMQEWIAFDDDFLNN